MVYRKSDNVVLREIAGETFLIPVRDKLADMRNLFVLHGIGEYVWSMIDGVTSKEGICQKIVDNFEVHESAAGEDLDELFSDLASAGLVQEA